VPAPLVAVALGILAEALFHLQALGVKLVGAIPSGLPQPSLPNPAVIAQLAPDALGIALIASVEPIAAARVFAGSDDPPLDANQELRALGMANIAGSLFQGMPAGGGTSQTAVNAKAGAKSQVAGSETAGVVALTLVALAPLVGLMPQAVSGALVLVAAVGLLHLDEFRALARCRSMEYVWALVAVAGVLAFGTLNGVLVMVIVSLLSILYHADRPPVYASGASHRPTYSALLPSIPTTRRSQGCSCCARRASSISPARRGRWSACAS
jgi:MFS superfamily sulfate permease-like transporter